MKNTFGSSVAVTLFGESHGPMIGAVLDGLAPGIPVEESYIANRLSLRRSYGDISTARREADLFQIVSGVFNGYTTGTPICILIPNNDVKSSDYNKIEKLARPGHADLTAFYKYHGFEDRRGGGHFSGRITAALVAAGAIAQSALEQKEIIIGTHIKNCAGIIDTDFTDLKTEIGYLNKKSFAVLSEQAEQNMIRAIKDAAQKSDSVGGILETAIVGLPSGVGEPWFDTLESVLSHALFGIPAIKGVEFGAGFGFADMFGSEANDQMKMINGNIEMLTNHNGGINGGISNGMPVVFRCAVKPTPSIAQSQQTVDVEVGEDTEIKISGRHDPAIVHRARAVVDAVTAIVLCDQVALRFGTDWLKGEA